MAESNFNQLYSKDAIEFVTLAAEFCVRLEHAKETNLSDFLDSMLKILPLFYVKSLALNGKIEDNGEIVEDMVTEEDYDYILSNVVSIMGSHDDYLDVFVEDMKYSDTPIRKTISEDLADIYQDVRNFLGIYKEGLDESKQAALFQVMESFSNYWGQRIVNVLRALHDVKFYQMNDEESLEINE